MTTITSLNASAATRVVNDGIKQGASLSQIMMAVAFASVQLNETKGLNIAKSAQANVNKLDAANQLASQLKTLEGMRAEKKIDKDKTMEALAADCLKFVENLKAAGIPISAEEYAKWGAGKMTDADIKTVESRIKTMSDSASNQSQMINLELSKSNAATTTSTNMFMSFLDTWKQGLDRIFR
jgi:hypothetical protein